VGTGTRNSAQSGTYIFTHYTFINITTDLTYVLKGHAHEIFDFRFCIKLLGVTLHTGESTFTTFTTFTLLSGESTFENLKTQLLLINFMKSGHLSQKDSKCSKLLIDICFMFDNFS